MLLEFSCENYRSIKNAVQLSMLATSDKEHKEALIPFNSDYFLRCSEIYGANGSGKTSVLTALRQMKSIVSNSYTYQPGDNIIRFPHKLSPKEPTTFSCIFVKNKKKYSYQFSYTGNSIISEQLYYWPENRISKIFDRSLESYEFSSRFNKYTEDCKRVFKKNRLLLSIAANVTDSNEIEEAFLFFKKDLIIFASELNNWLEYSVSKLQEDESVKKEFLDFMHTIGSDICDIAPKFEKKLPTTKDIPSQLPEAIKAVMVSQPINFINVELVYKNFTLNLNEESAGVQKLFTFICPLLDILSEGKIFICDEIESHLHPSIVQEILNKFLKNTKNNAQIILTTHDTDLLDLSQIRRDQIWFTEINPNERNTELYSLSEIKKVRKDENIKKGYIIGKYGAIPMSNTNIQNVCKE